MTSVRARLDRVFAELEGRQGPGVVVGIAQRGMPDYRRAFGLSSVEQDCRNRENTRMRIGSSTKQFTCFGVLLLAEDGLLSIDDNVRTHLPELPEYGASITLRHLMSNTSGLRCYLDLIGILASMDRAVPAPLPLHLQMKQQTVNFTAGERLVYCNGGYLLLSAIIERLSSMTLAGFFSKRIFDPLGMPHTTFEPSDTKLLENVATLHQRYPDGSYHRGTIGVPLTGDGAILSTVEDMLRWLTHMDSPIIGSAQTWKTMLSAGSDTEHGYGFGLMHERYRGIDTIHHGGTVFGGRCQALKVPEHGINIVMMSNASDIFPGDFTSKALDVLLEDRMSAPLSAATAENAQRFAGTYYGAKSGEVVHVLVKDQRAFVDGESGEAPLYDTPGGGLRTNAASLGIEIRDAGDGAAAHATAIELLAGGYRSTLQRLEPRPDDADLDAWCGSYENADCEATAIISHEPTPSMSISSPYGAARYTLEHVGGDVWYARLDNSWFPLKIVIEFAKDASGGGTLSITSGRTKRLAFHAARVSSRSKLRY